MGADQNLFGVTAADNRLFVEAVLYRYRIGMPRQNPWPPINSGRSRFQRGGSAWGKSEGLEWRFAAGTGSRWRRASSNTNLYPGLYPDKVEWQKNQ